MNTLDELERLLKAGTPGPWHVGHNELGDAQGPMSIWPDANMIGAIIARCGPQQPWQGWYEQPAHDAALIVAAINALPGLIERAQRAERLEAALQEIADRHVPDQPAAYDVPRVDYLAMQYSAIRALARTALKGT
jgi:hypothetical protein